MKSTLHHDVSPPLFIALLLILAIFPSFAIYFSQEFYIGLLSRLMIFALVASSLNLILGFGGMISLGHAAFFGSGAYVVGILMQHGIMSAWISWPLALLAGSGLALLIGSISLRTKGVYFIMITLAFAQMLYFLFVSLKNYGGDDGLNLPQRSPIISGLDMANDSHFYYVVLSVVNIFLFALYRLINSRFGRVIQAIKENETRMEAIGYPVFRYKLICFAIAGGVASLAGALLANQNMLVSPNLLHWTQSGRVMVILGGVGYLSGGVLGAVVMLMLEEILSGYTIHWQLYLGIILLLVVMLLPNGLASLPGKFRQRKSHAGDPS
jgi:branched-chain amino acid transport system permease protein